MTRWAKDTDTYEVSLNKSTNRDGSESKICRIPKPIVDMFGDVKKIQFKIMKDGIIIVGKTNDE